MLNHDGERRNRRPASPSGRTSCRCSLRRRPRPRAAVGRAFDVEARHALVSLVPGDCTRRCLQRLPRLGSVRDRSATTPHPPPPTSGSPGRRRSRSRYVGVLAITYRDAGRSRAARELHIASVAFPGALMVALLSRSFGGRSSDSSDAAKRDSRAFGSPGRAVGRAECPLERLSRAELWRDIGQI